MGRDRNLPDFFARVHGRTRTPYLALLASSGLIIFMALAIPIEDVAAAADVMFLLLFLQVNAAIITIRRKYGDKLDYGFLIPFFPILPIVAIVLMVGIAAFMVHFSPIAWFFVIGWIGVGFILYYAYAKRREREKRVTPVVLREALPEDRYRVLVPVANPARAGALIDLACELARARDGEVVLLHVILVPRQTPLRVGHRYVREARDQVLDRAAERVASRGVASSSILRIAHRPADAIIHEVEDREIDMVVMGWRGRRRHPRTALGANIDQVLRHADCHVAVLRADEIESVRRVLVPVAEPEQSHLMLEIGDVLAARTGGTLDLFHAIPSGLAAGRRDDRVRELYEGLADLDVRPAAGGDAPEGRERGATVVATSETSAPGGPRPRTRRIHIEETDSVVDRIVEKSKEYDLTIIGAAREGWARKLVAGTVPELIARRVPGRLLLVKHRRSAIHSRVLDTIDFFRDTTGAAAP